MRSGLVLGLSLFAACQHIDDIDLDDVGSPAMPVASEEPQRINIDEVGPRVVRSELREFGPLVPRLPGVSRVESSLADPRYPVIERARTVSREDDPPPVPASRLQTWFAQLSGADRRLVNNVCREILAEPCAGLIPHGEDQPSPYELAIAPLGPDASSAVAYCTERDGQRRCMTPLVVAFEGEIELVRGSGTFAFDPGVPVTTDWPTAATPWIALDRDGDGAITSGAELFGDATAVPGGTAANGFAALATLDANGDRVIDAKDPRFAELVLWGDRDGNRQSSRDELRPLSEVIIAIPLDHDVVPRCASGNCEGERGAMVWRDGTAQRTGAVIDLYLRRR